MTSDIRAEVVNLENTVLLLDLLGDSIAKMEEGDSVLLRRIASQIKHISGLFWEPIEAIDNHIEGRGTAPAVAPAGSTRAIDEASDRMRRLRTLIGAIDSVLWEVQTPLEDDHAFDSKVRTLVDMAGEEATAMTEAFATIVGGGAA